MVDAIPAGLPCPYGTIWRGLTGQSDRRATLGAFKAATLLAANWLLSRSLALPDGPERALGLIGHRAGRVLAACEPITKARFLLQIANPFSPMVLVMLAAAICWMVVVNVWTVLRFWQDKARAIAGDRRIPEADLLGLALIGGTPGAFAARRLFRHKTRKEPFSTHLLLIATAQIGAGGTLLLF